MRDYVEQEKSKLENIECILAILSKFEEFKNSGESERVGFWLATRKK